MTRSEEQVQVGTTSQEAGRARLRKYVVTEHETYTSRSARRGVLETEPITDANVGAAPPVGHLRGGARGRAPRGARDGRQDRRPVERVRLGTETTTERRP